MKILLLNCVYRKGSTGKIVASLSDTLRSHGHEVLTCYGIGNSNIDVYSKKICTNFEHNINALLSRIIGIPFGGFYLSNRRVEKIIRHFNPDVVHVHLLNGSVINLYSLLKYLSKIGQKTVLTLHAEVYHTAGCGHAFDCSKWVEGCRDCNVYRQRVNSWFFDRSREAYKKMYDAINSFPTDRLVITAVSPWLAARAKQSSITKRYNIEYVPNGVDYSTFFYRTSMNLIDREQYEKIILFVTPYFGLEENDNKGGFYLPTIASNLLKYKFVVVSSRTSSTLSELPRNIQLWGPAKTQEELAQLYSESDITLLLSKRETFSMVTAESLCCGTPVVGFKAGGPESIAIEDFTKFVDYGNVDRIIKEISFEWNVDKKEVSTHSRMKYSKDLMSALFYDLYVKL